MLTPEERALLTDMQDQLIELYVAKDEGAGRQDWGWVYELERGIDHVSDSATKSARSRSRSR